MVRTSTRFALPVALGIVFLLTACVAPNNGAIGNWGNTTEPQQPSLELSQDGTLSGTDGCNRLMGTFSVTGDEVTFHSVASTLMYCEGVDTWLAQLAQATVTNEVMTVYDVHGLKIGTLDRND